MANLISPWLKRLKLILAWISVANAAYPDPPDNRLNDFATLQHQMIGLKSELRSITNLIEIELGRVFSQLHFFNDKLILKWKVVEGLEMQQNATAEQVAVLEGAVADIGEDLIGLQASNDLWKQNFAVVNKTFTILKEKGCVK